MNFGRMLPSTAEKNMADAPPQPQTQTFAFPGFSLAKYAKKSIRGCRKLKIKYCSYGL